MASTGKVVLKTTFSDVFRVGDLEITSEGVELDRKTADEVLEAARNNHVQLHEVEAAPTKKTEGSGS